MDSTQLSPTPFEWHRAADLPQRCPERGFEVHEDGITIKWGGYDYFIDGERISTPGEICGWIAHICEKEWEGTTPEKIREFIIAVYKFNGWGYPS